MQCRQLRSRMLVSVAAGAWRNAESALRSSMCRWAVQTPRKTAEQRAAAWQRTHFRSRKGLGAAMGAGLARVSAASRGAPLATWRAVREHRRAWRWSQHWPGICAAASSTCCRRMRKAVGCVEPSQAVAVGHERVQPFRRWRGAMRGLRYIQDLITQCGLRLCILALYGVVLSFLVACGDPVSASIAMAYGVALVVCGCVPQVHGRDCKCATTMAVGVCTNAAVAL